MRIPWRAHLLALVLLLAASTVITGCSGDPAGIRGLKYVSSFEGGQKYLLGKYDVLLLTGTYREMGRQYGSLMKEELHEYSAYLHELLSRPDISKDYTEKAESNSYLKYPERFKKIVEGMSETSGLSVKEVAFLDFNYCSAVSAWGDYTGGGPLVVGRNNDFPGTPAGSEKYSNLVVYNPSDGSLPTAFFGDIGSVSCDTGYNANGLMIEANDGGIGEQDKSSERMLFALEMTQFMFDAGNLETLSAEVASTRPNIPQLCLVSDRNMGISYELAVNDYRKVPPTAEGLVVQTNHFVDPSWNLLQSQQEANLRDSPTSVRRYENLVNLANQNKGHIDASTMKTMMSTPIDEGGPFRPGETIAQQVFVPATLEWWISVPGYQDWIEVPLKALFERCR